MKRFLILFTAASAVLAASACTSPTSSGADTGDTKPIVIGAAVAKSGGFELYDDGQTAGMQFAIDKINGAGGVKGRQLQLITGDHKTDPAQVQATAQELLDKGADVIVTTVDYDFGAPAALAARKANKVSISGAGAPEFGMKGLGPLHFNVYQGTPSESVALAQLAYTDQKLRHPYLLEDTSIQYSKSLCDEFEKSWEKLAGPGTIAGKDTFKNTDPSVASQVSKIKTTAATDFVVLCSYPPGGASAIRQLRTAGVDLPIYGGSAFDGTFWTEAVPDLTNFYHAAMVSSGGDDPNSGVNTFLSSVKFTGSASYALFGELVIETIAKGIEKAGTADGPALAKAIESFKNEPLMVGPTTYSATCHAPIERQMAMLKIDKGKASFVKAVVPTGVPDTAC